MADARFDVTVLGGGPAGLEAAASAAAAGARTAIVDDNDDLGGQIWRRDGEASTPKNRVVARRRAQLERLGVTLLRGRCVVDNDGPQRLALAGEGGVGWLRCERLILCTGARELFLPFPGWTTPGVFGAGGLQALAKGGFDVAGKRVVVAGSGPLLLAVAVSLAARGASIEALVEQATARDVHRFAVRLLRHPSKLGQALALGARTLPMRRLYGSWPLAARGGPALTSVVVRTRHRECEIACDLLACGFGLVPEVGIARRLGCAIESSAVVVDDAQRSSVAAVFAAGEACGIGGLETALVEGRIAGLAAAGVAVPARLRRARRRARAFAAALARCYALRTELRRPPPDHTIVCRCEDVPFGAIRACASMRDAKLRTRAGMGPCQARVCGPAIEHFCGWPPETPRPPYFPVSLDALIEIGATFEEQT